MSRLVVTPVRVRALSKVVLYLNLSWHLFWSRLASKMVLTGIFMERKADSKMVMRGSRKFCQRGSNIDNVFFLFFFRV